MFSENIAKFCHFTKILLFFEKTGKKNAQPKFSEIGDFEKFPIFYTYILSSNFLYFACICLIFVFYERRRAIFQRKI